MFASGARSGPTTSARTREYVGLGPYRVDSWEPGASISGAAFDSFVFGRPKIERIRVVFENGRASVIEQARDR